VQTMVRSLLRLPEEIESEDAADALAVAICHSTHRGPGAGGWGPGLGAGDRGPGAGGQEDRGQGPGTGGRGPGTGGPGARKTGARGPATSV
jgi:hypothetical protein